MLSLTIKYKQFSLKLIVQLAIVCYLLPWGCVSAGVAQTIEPDKIITTKQPDIRLTPNEKKWLEKNPTIKVAVKSGWMPIEFKLESEEHRGLSIDYLNRLSNLLQVNFIVVDYIDNIKPDQSDIISGVSNNSLKNAHFRLLNQPFLVFPLAIYTNKYIKKKTKIYSLENLNGLRVAVFKSGVLGQKIKENYPGVKLVYVNIADEAFELLQAGEVEAYIGNEMVIDYHIAFNRLRFAQKTAISPFTASVSMAVRADQPELASILEKGLLALASDNKQLLKKWNVTDTKNNQIATTVLAVVASIFLLGLVRFYRLKQAIKKKDAESQQQIWHQANFDYLTKLPNRHLLHNRLEQAFDRSKRSSLPVGLLYIDLDNFKRVNDQSGHKIGDKLLIEAANRINACVRSSDTAARIGGDEFMVVMDELKDIYSLEKTCEKILSQLEAPFFIENNTFYISASLGITVYPDDTEDFEKLLVYADQAMYEAKKLGRNRYQFFTQSMQAISSNRLSIASDLRSALLNDEFIVYYQPIVNLKDSTITKAEALIRWNHPKKGMINPVDFISIAEETGLIGRLGQWVFEQALKDVSIIRDYLGTEFQLSINVSPHQFHHPESLLNWVNCMKELGIPGSGISLEITEGLLLEASDAVINTLSKLQGIGIELAIDDFGTGYSALAYLKKFDINYVKIDKSFIQNLESDNYDAVLCEAIIHMAHKLNIKIIAEGIEAVSQKSLLNQFGCDYAQGYLLATPQPLDNLLKFLRKS
ncbi:MAG: EAL domain-containing protein [Pseudomonadota bacterium]